MKTFKNHLRLAAAIGILTFTLALCNADWLLAQGPRVVDVFVTNTSSNPVPTLAQGVTNIGGNVGITGTPNVNAAQSGPWFVNAMQSGPWTVGVNGTPTVNLGIGNSVGINGSVQVGNTATDPVLVRDLDHPARQAYGMLFRCDLAAGQVSRTCDFGAPAGHVLVVETLSAFANPPIGHKAGYQFLYTSDGVNQAAITLALTDTFSFDGVHANLLGTQPVRLYVFPGSTMTLSVAQDSASSVAVGVTLSGFLVNCGAGGGCPLP